MDLHVEPRITNALQPLAFSSETIAGWPKGKVARALSNRASLCLEGWRLNGCYDPYAVRRLMLDVLELAPEWRPALVALEVAENEIVKRWQASLPPKGKRKGGRPC